MDDLAARPMPVPLPLQEGTFSTIADHKEWDSLMQSAHLGHIFGLDRSHIAVAFHQLWLDGQNPGHHTSAPLLGKTWRYMEDHLGLAILDEELHSNVKWRDEVFTIMVPNADTVTDKGIYFDRSRGFVRLTDVGRWDLLSHDQKDAAAQRIVNYKARKVIAYKKNVTQYFIEMMGGNVLKKRAFLHRANDQPNTSFFLICGAEFSLDFLLNLDMPENVVIITQRTLKALFRGDVKLHDIGSSSAFLHYNALALGGYVDHDKDIDLNDDSDNDDLDKRFTKRMKIDATEDASVNDHDVDANMA